MDATWAQWDVAPRRSLLGLKRQTLSQRRCRLTRGAADWEQMYNAAAEGRLLCGLI